nr:hypothetical protein [Paucibacter sp. M5-1]MCZ7881972.1 hypothetical protein [Paucibacter sp. M5-1]
MLLLTGSLCACSSLKPQLYPAQMLPVPEGGPTQSKKRPVTPSVAEAIEYAQQQQAGYAQADQHLGSIKPTSALGLIGMGAAGLAAGLGGGHARGVANLGVASTATYIFADTLSSPPRQQAYRAGIRALSCAIAATRPWYIEDTVLGAASGAGGGIRGDLKSADTAAATLRDTLHSLQSLEQEQRIQLHTPAATAAPYCAHKRLSCEPRAGNVAEAKAWMEQCERVKAGLVAGCQIRPASDKTITLAPAVQTLAAFQRARELLKLAEERTGRVRAGLRQTVLAGGALWDKTTEIVTLVNDEVQKTEPRLGGLLTALSSMQGLAGKLTQPIKTSGTGTQQAGLSSIPPVPTQEPVDTRKIDEARAALEKALAPLAYWSEHFADLAKNTQTSLSICSVPPLPGSTPEVATTPPAEAATSATDASEAVWLGLGFSSQDYAARQDLAKQTLFGQRVLQCKRQKMGQQKATGVLDEATENFIRQADKPCAKLEVA